MTRPYEDKFYWLGVENAARIALGSTTGFGTVLATLLRHAGSGVSADSFPRRNTGADPNLSSGSVPSLISYARAALRDAGLGSPIQGNREEGYAVTIVGAERIIKFIAEHS